ncbi:Cytochrome c6 precursor [Planctomycetes bacterium Poly30]|uniref:Cytochrome c6 n=1 Tax=Saltatorellus ferox TaxID=2528018 RepID=A0A518EMY3_9BACT|nr:Cytochrome c6 precursor [Planctomycetes bacterium Poly30]
MHRFPHFTAARLLAAILLASSSVLAACGGAALSDSAQRGRKVFLESSKPSCASCHQLLNAGSPKGFGPDLDLLRPTREQTVQSVTNGVKIMPPQKGILTPEQIEDVASYLLEVAGK